MTTIDKTLTKTEKVYYLVEDIVTRLGNTMWGSVAFEVEKGKIRGEINKMVSEALQQERENLAIGIGQIMQAHSAGNISSAEMYSGIEKLLEDK